MADQRQQHMSEADIRTRVQLAAMKEVGEVINATGLPTMTVLQMAVEAVGSIYREAAAAHTRSDPCPCGWIPQPAADIECLTTALARACQAGDERDVFTWMLPRGTA